MEPRNRSLDPTVLKELAEAPRDGSAEHPFLILTGPTGVGKTDLALDLAERMNAEILSADSRQVYRLLDIGTAKPSLADRRRVRHHFVDELDPREPFSAGIFARHAEERIDDIVRRGRVPLVTGGSTLYAHALQEGFAEVPAADAAVRTHIEQRLRSEGGEVLYAELQKVDPGAAATMDPTKTQRLVRALEVYEATGVPISEYHREKPVPKWHFETIVLLRSREVLYRRIEARVDDMLRQGLVREVSTVVNLMGLRTDLNPLRTIGYQEPVRFLQGHVPYAEMVRLIKRNTRRYAKRQITWFRRYRAFDLE
jgi:tRNA dimethylallyltransferase